MRISVYTLVLFCHVFPIAARHVLQLLVRIHALLNADSLEVRTPEVLKQLVVVAQHLSIHLAIPQVKRHGGLVLEGDVHNGFTVIVVAVVPLRIVYQPRLVIEAILKVVSDDGQHVMVWRDNAQIRTVLRLLKTDKLLHAQLFMQHTSGDIRYGEDICISEVP